MNRPEDPIIVAFDLGDRERMRSLADRLQGRVETVKIGLEAYTCLGPEVLDEMKARGFKVFADLKLFDIPNTVRGSIRGLVRRGVDMITLHTMGGEAMLRDSIAACSEEAREIGMDPPVLLGVTVLTSLDDAALRDLGISRKSSELVLNLANMGIESGLDGLVASAWEVESLREKLGEEIVVVTPGIRLPGSPSNDQSRVATPAEAMDAGADYIVVGRAITAKPDPVSALGELRNSAGL